MAETMLVDGAGTCIGALFGSFYSTTVYIGHPIHKALGAKRGYSLFNGVLYFILLLRSRHSCLACLCQGCCLACSPHSTNPCQSARVAPSWSSWACCWGDKPSRRRLPVITQPCC